MTIFVIHNILELNKIFFKPIKQHEMYVVLEMPKTWPHTLHVLTT